VHVAASSWCVLQEQQPPGTTPAAAAAAGGSQKCRPGKLLHVSLVLPEPTEEEVQYKKGEGSSTAAAAVQLPCKVVEHYGSTAHCLKTFGFYCSVSWAESRNKLTFCNKTTLKESIVS
jgi:hypothetical protein